MNTNRQIEISQQIYNRLLVLYPQEHRSEYGTEMALLFADQCRRGRQPTRQTWPGDIVAAHTRRPLQDCIDRTFIVPTRKIRASRGDSGKAPALERSDAGFDPWFGRIHQPNRSIKRKRLVFYDPHLGWICLPGACIAGLVADKEISNLGSGSNRAGVPQSF